MHACSIVRTCVYVHLCMRVNIQGLCVDACMYVCMYVYPRYFYLCAAGTVVLMHARGCMYLRVGAYVFHCVCPGDFGAHIFAC